MIADDRILVGASSDPALLDREAVARALEGIILRRMHEKRIEGYTLEMSREQADAILSLSTKPLVGEGVQGRIPDCGHKPEQSGQCLSPAWQPIDTAPKDGSAIIGAFWNIRWADSHRRNDIVRCWYQPEFEAFISSCREMTLAPGYTFENGASRELHSPVIEPVTHWMPLPPSPSSTSATATETDGGEG